MAVTGVAGKPQVVFKGGAREEQFAYNDGGTYAAGDLIRLNSSGEIVIAGVTTATDGAIHGMALFAGTDSGDPAKILMFADDTRISIPCSDTVAPEDISKGTMSTLETSGGLWAVTGTATAGVVIVTDYEGTKFPFVDVDGSFDKDPSVNNNRVIVRVPQSILDASGA